MLKPKTYDLEDSNVENIGGEDHKKLVKDTAVKGEPAWKKWQSYLDGSILKKADEAKKDAAGNMHHVEIWRIEKFKVKFWPREQFGQFFSGDSYIILHTYAWKRDGQEGIAWDLHFWLGKDTTQDEMGTAAYKTVELDTVLEDGPVQIREVQEHESDKFAALFSDIYKCGGIRYMDGGVDSGFRHVEPASYKPRLMQVKGNKKRVRVLQVPLSMDSLNAGDLFILDNGLKVYSWKGESAGMFERNKGRELTDSIKVERKGKCEVFFLNQGDAHDPQYVEFCKLLGGDVKTPIKAASAGGHDDAEASYGPNALWKLSDASGKMTFQKVGEGKSISKSSLDSNDVFILDAGHTIFAWVGKNASYNEKQNAIPYATQYLADEGRPAHLPVIRVLDGSHVADFETALAK